MTLLLGLAAVLAMFADGLLQVLLSFVDLLLAFVIAIKCIGWNYAGKEAANNRGGNEEPDSAENLSHEVPSLMG
jgi:hypothetical protein